MPQLEAFQGAQIIAYVFPNGRLISASEIDATQVTRINYAFALIKDGRVVEGEPSDAANLATLQTLKHTNPGMQVLISVGGWLGSGGFSDAALTHESRARFIESAIDFLLRYKLDGLDLDWEYPGLPGSGNRFRPEDGTNFTLLLQELRSRFDSTRKTGHRSFLLTIAAGASDLYLAHTQMSEAARSLDTVNLMAYDYYESSDATTGHHAPLFANPADRRGASAAASVRAFEQAGVPTSKLVLGVPFYGHAWGNVPPEHHGLFQHGSPAAGVHADYASITNELIGHGFTRYWDDVAAVPFLYSDSQRIFISYEDPQSLRRKCAYMRQEGLAGVMFWQYFSDSSGELLRTLSTSLRNAPVKATP